MLILKQKTNTPIFKDTFGNEYDNLVIQVGDIHISVPSKKMEIELRYYKDLASMATSGSILQQTFSWDAAGTVPTDVEGNEIDWATFMATELREEWKDKIAQVGRIPFDDLAQGIDTTIGLDFRPTATGQAWKEIMLFLPVHPSIAEQTGVKFLDEVFEYATI